MTLRSLAIGAVAVVVLGGASDTAVAAPAATGAVQHHERTLDGSWIVNEDLSDDLRPRPPRRDGDDERRDRGSFGRPGRGRFGGRGGGFGGDPERAARMRANLQEALRDLLTAPRRMTIVTDPDEIVLTYDDGRVVRLIPDDRERAGLAGTSAQVTRRTSWRGTALEAEIELQARVGIRVHQSYEVRTSDGHRQLLVTTRVDGGRRGREREFRRVYDSELQ